MQDRHVARRSSPGQATIRGVPVGIGVMDLAFIGGSMGWVVGEKVARLFERCAEQRLPAVMFCATGGARMQESLVSLMQMAKTAGAAGRLARAGLPYISVLTDPTYGGVTASFAFLGDIIIAEPEAAMGFAGPRVIEVTNMKMRPGVQTAEFQYEHGMIDLLIAPRADPRDPGDASCAGPRRPWSPHPPEDAPTRRPAPGRPQSSAAQPLELTPWERVQLARHQDRAPTRWTTSKPSSRTSSSCTATAASATTAAIVAGLGCLDGLPVAIIGQQKGRTAAERRSATSAWRGPRATARPCASWSWPRGSGARSSRSSTPRAPTAWRSPRPRDLRGHRHQPARHVRAARAGGLRGHRRGRQRRGHRHRRGRPRADAGERLLLRHRAGVLRRDPVAQPGAQGGGGGGPEADGADALELGITSGTVPEPPGGAHVDKAGAAAFLRKALVEAFDSLKGKRPEELVQGRYNRFRYMSAPEGYRGR